MNLTNFGPLDTKQGLIGIIMISEEVHVGCIQMQRTDHQLHLETKYILSIYSNINIQ